jgi:hypothetical protein
MYNAGRRRSDHEIDSGPMPSVTTVAALLVRARRRVSAAIGAAVRSVPRQ